MTTPEDHKVSDSFPEYVFADGTPAPSRPMPQRHPDPAWDAILSLRAENDRVRQRESWMIASALTGRGGTLFGKPVVIRIEWPEGLPAGMTEDDLRAMGQGMLPS